MEARRLGEVARTIPRTHPVATEKGKPRETRKLYCYFCQQEGHYSNQCLVKAKEKQRAVNMLVIEATDVQQITTRSKGKTVEWEAQAVPKATKEWVEKANH